MKPLAICEEKMTRSKNSLQTSKELPKEGISE